MKAILGVALRSAWSRRGTLALVPASYEFGSASAQCDKSRIAHGLPALTPDDWIGVAEAEKNPLPRQT